MSKRPESIGHTCGAHVNVSGSHAVIQLLFRVTVTFKLILMRFYFLLRRCR